MPVSHHAHRDTLEPAVAEKRSLAARACRGGARPRGANNGVNDRSALVRMPLPRRLSQHGHQMHPPHQLPLP